MISATIVNANTRTADAGADQSAGLTQAGAAESANDFLTQLQSAMGEAVSAQETALPVEPQELEVPLEELAEVSELQNLPTASVQSPLAPANFAVPLTLSGAALATAQTSVVVETHIAPAAAPQGAVQAPLPSNDQIPMAVPSSEAPVALSEDVPSVQVPPSAPKLAAQVALEQGVSTSNLPEPSWDAVRREPLSVEPVSAVANPQTLRVEPVVALAAESQAAVAQALAPALAVSGEVAAINKSAPSLSAMPDVQEGAATEQEGLQELASMAGDDFAQLDSAASADKPAAASVFGAGGVSTAALLDAPDAGANSGLLPGGGVSTTGPASTSAVLETTQRMPLEPHQMRLDSGPVQVEVLKLVRQGGGQIVMELTPPDQGMYRLDLRLDSQGRAHLFVEGASDSVRTRLEQSEAVLREQLSQMGLDLQLNYRQESRSFAESDASSKTDAFDQGANKRPQDAAFVAEQRTRSSAERGLVHLYA